MNRETPDRDEAERRRAANLAMTLATIGFFVAAIPLGIAAIIIAMPALGDPASFSHRKARAAIIFGAVDIALSVLLMALGGCCIGLNLYDQRPR